MRRRVLVLVGATTSLVLVAFLVPLALLVRGVAVDRAVQGATVQAQALSSMVVTAHRDTLAVAVEQADATSAYDVSVFLADGSRLGAAVPRSPLVELASRGSSASGEVPGGREIVFAVRDSAGAYGVIRAFVSEAELTRGVARAWLLLAGLGVVLLGMSLLVADRLARRLVRSTIELASVSHHLAAGDLDARADPGAPDEIGRVAAALNHLAGRISELLREERETVADLSHRVRTPLTALRLDAEALADRHEAVRIEAGVDAVQRAVTQAIDQARRRSAGSGSGCDAAEVVRERVDFWAVLAEDTDREIGRDLAPGPLPVTVGRGELAACVDALLGNVFAHTPDGTAFEVRLYRSPDGEVLLSIDDAGPGLPEPGLARRGESGSGSSGLGLDIARRTAQRAGGDLRLGRSALGGLSVTLQLLAAP
ncbi:sensor histidine kinase [Actinopolymorpha pittospori]|uniref:Signal transduction histidine-protein kinase/phosphatase MprB n=1 Tax=Actinopolymorpha pittospori TaxID=648752 RepID=A0A927RHA5_9ACTN|nr:HAMP domain-containing sensor histidine kinase [Actinopolymorpha pittospori]MBE1612000.1 signal transduction histidine kinase [Actinopolymorpha pittospori]